MRLTERAAQRWLCAAWLAGLLSLCALLLFVLTGSRPDDEAAAFRDWLIPLAVPTTSLMFGVLFASGGRKQRRSPPIDPFLFFVALIVSIGYLVAMMIVMLSAAVKLEPARTLHQSAILLQSVQGLVGIALGAFFVRRSEAEEPHEEVRGRVAHNVPAE